MKRWCLLVAVLLGLGAVTSVAIAWARAMVYEGVVTLPGVVSLHEEERYLAGPLFVRQQRSTGETRRAFETHRSVNPHDYKAIELPHWSLAHDPRPLRGDRDAYAVEVSHGWPFRCLRASGGCSVTAGDGRRPVARG